MMIDSHVHVFPDVDERVYDVTELVDRAKAAGFGGLVLKSSQTETAGLASLYTSEELPLWGGLVLNKPCGGLNPAAVDSMFRTHVGEVRGLGRIVWLPTRHSDFHIASIAPQEAPGVKLWIDDDPSKPRPELIEIFDQIAEHDAVLATGHANPLHLPAIVKLAKSRGVERIIITHVDQGPSVVSPEAQKELSDEGCFIEHCFVGLYLGPNALSERLRARTPATMEGIIAGVKATGASHAVFSTDAGAIDFPEPVAAMQKYLSLLGEYGIDDGDIERGSEANVLSLLTK